MKSRPRPEALLRPLQAVRDSGAKFLQFAFSSVSHIVNVELEYSFSQMRTAVLFTLPFILSLWLVYLIDLYSDLDIAKSAEIEHLKFPEGFVPILYTTFVHTSFPQIAAITIPLFVCSTMVVLRSVWVFIAITLMQNVIGGAIVWSAGPVGKFVLGSSGLLFAYFTNVLTIGIFGHEVMPMMLGIISIICYSSVLEALFPYTPNEEVLWQTHLTGVALGVFVAVIEVRVFGWYKGLDEEEKKDSESLLSTEGNRIEQGFEVGVD